MTLTQKRTYYTFRDLFSADKKYRQTPSTHWASIFKGLDVQWTHYLHGTDAQVTGGDGRSLGRLDWKYDDTRVGDEEYMRDVVEESLQVFGLHRKTIEGAHDFFEYHQDRTDIDIQDASHVEGSGNSELTFTADKTGYHGDAGNLVSITIVDPGTSGSLDVSVSGMDITITLAHDGVSVTSTALDVEAAVNADSEANVIISCTYGGDGLGLVSTLSQTSLAGGDDLLVIPQP